MKVLWVIALTAAIAVVYGDTCNSHLDCKGPISDNCDYDESSVCYKGACKCTDGPTAKACLQEPDCDACPAHHTGLCIDYVCHCADSDDHTYG